MRYDVTTKHEYSAYTEHLTVLSFNTAKQWLTIAFTCESLASARSLCISEFYPRTMPDLLSRDVVVQATLVWRSASTAVREDAQP